MTPLHTWALFGALAGIALPAVIHLMTKPRGERRPLAPFRFLIDGLNSTLKHNRLRNFLILLARTLAIVCIALGFARFAERSKAAAGDQPRSMRRIVVLDCSMSMRAVSGGAQVFDRARSMAQRLFEDQSVKQGELILAAHSARSVFGKTSTNLVALRNEVAQAQALLQKLDATAAVTAVGRTVSGLKEEDLDDCEVVIISDLQRSNWTKAGFTNLPKKLNVKIVPVRGEEPLANVSILKASIAGLPEAGAPFYATAEIANYSADKASVDVELAFDGRSWSRKVEVDAQAVQAVSIQLNDIPAGWRHGGFKIAAAWGLDALADDNTYPLCVQVRSSRRIAVVTQERSTETGGPAYFLERGLEASPESTVKIQRYTPAQLEGEVDDALLKSDLLAVVNCGRLTDAQAAAIHRVMASGMPVIFVAQHNVDADNIRMLQTAAGSALRLPVNFALLPAAQGTSQNSALSGMMGSRGKREAEGRFLVSVNTDRRPFKIFGDAVTRLTQSLRMTGGLFSSAHEGTELGADSILAKYSDGSAALVITRVASGTLALMNMSVGGEGRHLGAHPLFVPLIQELCLELFSIDEEHSSPRGLCGAPLAVPLPRASSTEKADFRLLRGDGSVVALGGENAPAFRTDAGGTVLSWPMAGEPGAYLLERGGEHAGGFTVVAPMADESDLSVLDPKVLTGRMAQDRTLTVVGAEEIEEHGDDLAKERLDYFFIAAAALLFFELLLLKAFRA